MKVKKEESKSTNQLKNKSESKMVEDKGWVEGVQVVGFFLL